MQDPLFFFFEKHGLLERVNKDGYTNNNGNKLIELCKMSDLKITNYRLGKDRGIGNYTCHTTNGNSTIDYALNLWNCFPMWMIFLLIFLTNVCLMFIVLYV